MRPQLNGVNLGGRGRQRCGIAGAPYRHYKMAMSEFYRALRDKVGNTLVLMPAVAAIVRDERGRVLLQQKHDDSWSLPAGAIEPGESPSDAVVREVLEETGLTVVPTRVAAVVGGESCRVRYSNGDEVEYLVTVFDCTVFSVSGSPAPDETKRVAYFDVEQMPQLAFAYPAEIFRRAGEATYFLGPHA
jgi:8-oxo-dGTP pyrophosphatase MutT (NUDIX family)